MKKIIMMMIVTVLITTGCSKIGEPKNVGIVQGLEPIESTIVTANKGEYASLYNGENYSMDNPFIAIDAYGMNPLSAYVVFPIKKDATYSYTVVGKDDSTNYSQTSNVVQSDNMIIPIIGLYQAYNNTIEIIVDYVDGGYDQFAINIYTKPLDTDVMTTVNVDTSASDAEIVTAAYEGGFLFTASGDAFDSKGDIRINFSQNGGGIAQPFHYNEDGTLLTYANGKLTEMDLTGRTLTEYNIDETLHPHHDVISASNGYVYALMTPNYTYEEYVETGVYNEGIIAVWAHGEGEEPILVKDLSPEFEENKVNAAPTNQEAGTDVLHLNSIDYYEPTDTIMVSSQSQNMIIGLDANDLSVKWTTADEEVGSAYEDLKLEWLDGHVHSNGQHNILVTDNPKYDDGDSTTIEVTMFSNYYCVDENGKSIYEDLNPNLSFSVCPIQTKSEMLVYRIDTINNTVETLDQFGFEGYASATMSGWTQSLDYKYSYVTYANQSRMLILNENYEIIGEVGVDDEWISGGGIYRMPIFTAEELRNISDTSLANTNY